MVVAQTYDFQQQVRQMQDTVDVIITKAPVLFGLIGTGEGLTQTKFEWMNDYLNSDTADVASEATAEATEIEVKPGEASKFTVNALVQNGHEVLQVPDADDTGATSEFVR